MRDDHEATKSLRLAAYKASVIHDLFVRAADDNYIAARWCSANALYVDFLWLALHAVEKYSKAALLQNDISVKKYGHDIVGLYKKLQEVAEHLLPQNLIKPAELDISYWLDRTALQFIEHLARFGSPDNRYLIYGYSTFAPDLHNLDQLVWAIRRLVVPLDKDIGRSVSSDENLPTFREILTKQRDWHFDLGMLPLNELLRLKNDDPKRFALLNLNFAFAPADFQHKPMRSGSASFNPTIYRHVFEPLSEGNALQVDVASELAMWMIENIKLPGKKNDAIGLVDDMKLAIEAAKKRGKEIE